VDIDDKFKADYGSIMFKPINQAMLQTIRDRIQTAIKNQLAIKSHEFEITKCDADMESRTINMTISLQLPQPVMNMEVIKARKPSNKDLMFFPIPKGYTFPPVVKPPEFIKKVGQIWEHREKMDEAWDVPDDHVGKSDALTLAKCAVKIVEIEDDGIYVEVIKNEKRYPFLTPGLSMRFKRDDFEKKDNNFFRLLMNDLPGPQTCTGCRQVYAYANGPNQADGTFSCWGCRNGF
jgi:hypothetical protein